MPEVSQPSPGASVTGATSLSSPIANIAAALEPAAAFNPSGTSARFQAPAGHKAPLSANKPPILAPVPALSNSARVRMSDDDSAKKEREELERQIKEAEAELEATKKKAAAKKEADQDAAMASADMMKAFAQRLDEEGGASKMKVESTFKGSVNKFSQGIEGVGDTISGITRTPAWQRWLAMDSGIGGGSLSVENWKLLVFSLFFLTACAVCAGCNPGSLLPQTLPTSRGGGGEGYADFDIDSYNQRFRRS